MPDGGGVPGGVPTWRKRPGTQRSGVTGSLRQVLSYTRGGRGPPSVMKYMADAEHMRDLAGGGGSASVAGVAQIWCSPSCCGFGPHRLS